MKAEIKTNHFLEVKKIPLICMLVLEWIANFKEDNIKSLIVFTIKESHNKEMFRIYLLNSCLSHYENLKEYIELNS